MSPRQNESHALESESLRRRFLVALDLGIHADAILLRAQHVAGPQAEFVLVHVVCDLARILGSYRNLAPAPRLQDDLLIDAKSRLRRLAAECFPNGSLPRELVLCGSVWRELVAAAQRHRVDAIVLGATEADASGRSPSGSTVTSVLWHAPCAVVVVPLETT